MKTYPAGNIEYTPFLETVAIKLDLPSDKDLGYSPDITDVWNETEREFTVQKQLF